MDERIVAFIKYLFEQGITPAGNLAAHFQVSTRTIRTYVRRANEVLVSIASISSSRSGYEIVIQDRDAFNRRLANDFTGSLVEEPIPTQTRAERISYLLSDLLLRDDWVTLDKLSEILFVTPRTISDDLHEVEKCLGHYHLNLEKRPRYGIKVCGPEFSRRLCLAAAATSSSSVDAFLPVDAHTVTAIGCCVRDGIKSQGINLSSVAFQNLVVHIAITVERIKADEHIPMPEAQLREVQSAAEYPAAQLIANKISDELSLAFPESEIAYIAIHLMGKRSFGEDASASEPEMSISEEAWDLVLRMVQTIHNTFHVDFSGDLELKMGLAQHIMPLMARLKYCLGVRNPMLSDIKRRFPLAYTMACAVASLLQEVSGCIPSEDELGYIALSFAFALERRQTGAGKKNLLVVCASGRGSAQLLELRCREEFGSLIGTITSCDVHHVAEIDFSDIDYVFTTVPLTCAVPVPVRLVSNFLSSREAEQARSLLKEPGRAILTHFSQDLFFPHLAYTTRDEVLSFLCDRLHQAGKADDSLFDFVLKREELGSTSFGGSIALPHPAKPIGAETCVAVGLLDNPVLWDEAGHLVQAVFLISFSQAADGRELNVFFKRLSQFVTDETAVDQLVRAQSWGELTQLL